MNGKIRKRKSTIIPSCKYGSSCYQKNPEHHKKYSHPEPVNEQKHLSIPGDEGDCCAAPKIKQISPSPKKTTRISVKEKDFHSEDKICDDEIQKRKTCLPEPKFTESVQEVLENMPQDFFDFWDFCMQINPLNPKDAFVDLGLQLVGVYDLLSKKLPKKEKVLLHCHWRYYYDPPEMQTVIKSNDKDLYHIGYFRDDPSKLPAVLVSNSATVGSKLTLKGDNIFAAMNQELTQRIKNLNPKLKKKFTIIHEDLQEIAKKKKHSLQISTPKTAARSKKVVSKTFNGFGIVVPVKNDVGYRPLPDSDATVKAILKKIINAENEDKRLTMEENLDELITNVQFANDECDFGMGLELGLDLFFYGEPYFHKHILNTLPLAYNLLNRPKYAEIVKFHLADRKKSDDLSTLNKK